MIIAAGSIDEMVDIVHIENRATFIDIVHTKIHVVVADILPTKIHVAILELWMNLVTDIERRMTLLIDQHINRVDAHLNEIELIVRTLGMD